MCECSRRETSLSEILTNSNFFQSNFCGQELVSFRTTSFDSRIHRPLSPTESRRAIFPSFSYPGSVHWHRKGVTFRSWRIMAGYRKRGGVGKGWPGERLRSVEFRSLQLIAVRPNGSSIRVNTVAITSRPTRRYTHQRETVFREPFSRLPSSVRFYYPFSSPPFRRNYHVL